MADDLINLPDVILDETEENREAAASIEEEMHAEEEEEREERPSEDRKGTEDAATRSDREAADLSGMGLGDEDMIGDEVPNSHRGEGLNMNEDGNDGDDEYSERTIKNDELIHPEDNIDEVEENDGEYRDDIIQSPSGGNEESNNRNETIEKEEEKKGDEEEEKEDKDEEEKVEERSEENEEDEDEREKEIIEDEEEEIEREREEIRDDEEEIAEKEDDRREENEDEIRKDNSEEKKDDDQPESHSLPPVGPSSGSDDIEEKEENEIDEDPIESTSDNIEEYTVKHGVEDTIENPVEDTVEDTIEDIVEDIGDIADNTRRDPIEDNEEGPMEVPVEEIVEEPIEDKGEDTVEDAVEETEENPREDTVEDSIQDPMEGIVETTGDGPIEVPMEDTVESNKGDEDTVVQFPLEAATIDERDSNNEEMREDQPNIGKGGEGDEEEKGETVQKICVLQPMEEKEEEKKDTNEEEIREEDGTISDQKDDDDEDIQFLEMVLPAAILPLPLSTGEGASIQPIQKMLSPRKDGVPIVESSGGSEAVRQTQVQREQERPKGYLLQQGGFQQIGVPVMDDSMVRRMKISGGIGSGGTVVINQSPMMITASSSSSSSSTRSNPHSSLPSRSVPIVPLPLSDRKEKERRKRKAVEEKEKEMSEEPEHEEFCMGDQRRLRPPVYYDDAPSSWRTKDGIHTIRMDKIVIPSKLPSREKWVGMDLRTYEGSENVDDIYTVSRIISWRDEGSEYDLAQEAMKKQEAAKEKEGKGNSSRTPNQGNEQRMKSPRPSIQSTKIIPSGGGRQTGGKTDGQRSTQVRLAPPPPTQTKEVDRETHKAQVLQKIESARRGYAAAREASIMRMGTTYQIPQADGTIKEFVLAHLPPEQAQRPGFIQVLPQSIPSTSSVPPPNQSPVKVVINQHPSVVSTPNPPSATVNVTPPGADDLSTRYARYLAQMAAKNGQQ